jgi:uncharacterized damage-inducible protein DinB
VPIVDAILPEFDQEMANTRKVLERVPDSRLGWRPHAKSWTMAELATHVATLPTWTVLTFVRDELDLAPGGKTPERQAPVKSRDELLAKFDRAFAEGREVLASAGDASMLQPWTLLKNGAKVMSLPRAAVLRSFVLNHSIHHRGQLTVYLRLCDVPVPALYGASADESPF